MTTSMFPQEGAPRDPPSAAVGPDEPRREAPSFADISGEFPDPVLLERQQRLRRVVGGVMAGAVGLLFIAGICGAVRRSSADADIAHVAPAIAAPEVTPIPDPVPASPTAASPTPVANAEAVAVAPAHVPAAPPRAAPMSKARRARPLPMSGSAAALVRPH